MNIKHIKDRAEAFINGENDELVELAHDAVELLEGDVFVVSVHHKHGHDPSAHWTKEGAKESAGQAAIEILEREGRIEVKEDSVVFDYSQTEYPKDPKKFWEDVLMREPWHSNHDWGSLDIEVREVTLEE